MMKKKSLFSHTFNRDLSQYKNNRYKKFANVFLFAIIAGVSSNSFALTDTEVLQEIKNKTIQLVDGRIIESQKVKVCFVNSYVCDPAIKANLGEIRRAIIMKNQEYRMLTALSNQTFFLGASDRQIPTTSAKLSISTPPVFLNREAVIPMVSELQQAQNIGRFDRAMMDYDSKEFFKNMNLGGSHYDPVEGRISLHKAEAARFYRIQAIIAAQSVPFIVFLNSDHPTDAEIVKAVDTYITQAKQVGARLRNLEENPLESFLLYEPVVTSVVKNSPIKQKIVQKLLSAQAQRIGVQGWIDRNSFSLKMAAFTTCSFVGAMLQSWPISLTCISTAVVLTSKQLYVDYWNMKSDFALWLSGAQVFNNLENSEAKLLYTSIVLFFAGQGAVGVVTTIDGGLIATLKALPKVTAQRFSNLTSMREGMGRFVSSQFNFKSRDLALSVFAASTVDNTKMKNYQVTSRRIFTYSDLLNLRNAVGAAIK